MSHEYLQVDKASSKLTEYSQGFDLDIKSMAMQSRLRKVIVIKANKDWCRAKLEL